MRFITFLKQVPKNEVDENMLQFKKWFLTTKLSTRHPQAGMAQIELTVATTEVTPQIFDGYLKWKAKHQIALNKSKPKL